MAGRRPGRGLPRSAAVGGGGASDGPFTYRIDAITDDGWSYTNDPRGSFTGLEVTGPTDPIAVLEAHVLLSTPPDGHFARILVVQRRDETGLDTVRGCVHVRVDDAGRHTTDLSTYDEWRAALVDIGVSLDGIDDADLRGLWERSWGQSPEAAGWRRGGHSLPMPDDLLAIADELYALPLADFTPARDAKAKELKGTDSRAEVKALKKPSLAAWVVDLLARREADQVEQVLTVGAALREAQAAMSANSLRELTKQRRQLTAAVTQQARALASEAGVKVTQAVADQVEATLTAAMVDETCAQAVRSGLLVAALSATGVDEVDVAAAVAVPEALGFVASPRDAEVPGPPDLHVVPDPDADQKASPSRGRRWPRPRSEVTEAQTRSRRRADLEQLEARSMQLQAEIDELRRKLSDLETAYEEVDDELADAEDVRSEAEETAAPRPRPATPRPRRSSQGARSRQPAATQCCAGARRGD